MANVATPAETTADEPFGAYVGRFSPPHLGHEALIRKMLKEFGKRHLLFIGSCNHELSPRHFFTLAERIKFIRTIFPDVRLVGLPDFPGDDASWFQQLDSMLMLAGADPEKVMFAGGSPEDVSFFLERKRKVHILDRYSGETPKVSASEVRNALIKGHPIDTLVNKALVEPITECFAGRWDAFMKT